MNNIVMKVFKVGGMTCHNCEKTIENALNKMDGIVKVKASFKNKTVMIKYDTTKVSTKLISSSVEKIGYVIITEGNNKMVIVVSIIFLGLYLIFKNTNMFNFIPEVKDNIGYGLLFVVGLLTSVHCIAMCGGINISVCINNNGSNKFKPGLLYNLGRLASYTIIGGIVGGIGSTISFSEMSRDIVSVITGAFMVILGLNMTNLFKNINVLNVRLPKFLSSFISKQKKHTKSPFIIGLLNGFMPCGPMQTMQLYALGTGSIIKGALSMFVFAAGTIPLMLSLSSLSGFLSGKMSVNLKKLSGVLVVVLGIVMFNRGFDYSFISNLMTQKLDFKNVASSVMRDGFQEVTTRFKDGKYQPIVVQKGIPVKWIIDIEKGDLNGCNNSININEYDISFDLDYGDNIVTFTPGASGVFKYTCWMRMISSFIYVVDDIATIK